MPHTHQTLIITLALPLLAQERLLWEFTYQQPLARWHVSLGHSLRLGPDSIALRLTYRALSEDSYRASFRNEAQGELTSILPLPTPWALCGRMSGDVFQDFRLRASERFRGRLLVGALYQKEQGFVQGLIGWEVLRQSLARDEGWSGGIVAAWNPRSLPLSARLSAEGTQFRGWRRWYDIATSLAWKPLGTDTLVSGVYRTVSQDLPGVGVEFQRRREQTASGVIRITEALSQDLLGHINLSAMHIRLWQHRIQPYLDSLPLYSTRFAGELASALFWSTFVGAFQARFALRYTEETYRADISGDASLPPELQQRRLQLALQEYTSLWSQLALSADLSISRSDTLALFVLLGIFRYDTPSPQNTDDRDEQQGAILVQYRRSWRRGQKVRAAFELQRRHTVFLQAQRSAWNHQLYILTLRWEARWSGHHVDWNPQWELLASYTVRDYPYTNVLQDLALRQWAYQDSLVFRLTPQWGGEVLLSARISRVGALDWHRFAEQPQSATREFSAALLIRRREEETLWGLGLRASSYTYTDVRLGVVSRQLGIGPQVRLVLPTPYGDVLVSGWYELRRSGADPHWSAFPWLSLQLRKP